jgi:GABA permease
VFAFLVNSYGTVAIFVYVLIAISELKLRARLERESPDRLRMRMWAFPHLTRLTIVAMLAIVAAMALIPAQRIPLVFGIVSVMFLLVAYELRNAFGSRPPDAS